MSTPAPETTAKKKLDAPYGWVIKTYKRMNIPSSDHEKTEEVFSDLINLIPNEGSVRDVTYGNYDRISMYPVNCFSDFTDRSYKTIDWYGSSQAIILFPLEQDSSKRTYVWGRKSEDENNKVYLQDEGGIRVPEGFFAISFCYISDEARNHVGNYREFLQECRDRINSLVELYNSKLRNDEGAKEAHGTIRAEVFGSFSPAELVILWSAPQYSDILYLIDLIRLFRFPSQQKKGADGEEKGASFDLGVFRTTYTMLSFPNVLNNNLLETFPLKNVKGKAHIQFVMQSSFGECAYDEFEKFLRSSLENAAQMTGDSLPPDYNLDVCRCAGEYDMIWTVDSRYLPCIHVNPLKWISQKEPEGKFDPDNPKYYFCNAHHPKYNQYVLYSFTRLSYKESDIPKFARMKGSDEEVLDWNSRVKDLSEFTSDKMSETGKSFSDWRSSLIRTIKDKRNEELEELLNLVESNIPTISNLREELFQLYSDYVQCCSSCADYLWIEDYDQLFQQVFASIRKSIESILIWKSYDQTDVSKEGWEDARGSLQGISSLIQALHQQTSHISASSKLFFKEQDIHFGYTAQHDLVLHAYYDIIKRLLESIYSYTNVRIQSKLYPLVNFCPEYRISSEIYTEESAQGFLKDNKDADVLKLRPRVMVIHIPLDGMDNLMHYMPMLVHEVYHYAAPRDREKRNRTLAKITIYQILRYGFGMEYRERLAKLKKENSDTVTLPEQDMEKRWQKRIDDALFDLLETKENEIFEGIKKLFFVSENEGREDRRFAEEAPVLRNWFIQWLKNWLNDIPGRAKGKKRDIKFERTEKDGYEDFGDILPDVFRAVEAGLQDEISAGTYSSGGGGAQDDKAENYFVQAVSSFLEGIRLYRENDDAELLTAIYRKAVGGYVNEEKDYDIQLKQLDEIFPDIAMVVLMKMPASGYMLQIALDLDKQMYQGTDYDNAQIRFASVLHFIFCLETSINKEGGKDKPEKFDEAKLNSALMEFKQLYLASYKFAARNGGVSDADKKRADSWCRSFRNMYFAYHSDRNLRSFGHIRVWVRALIDEMAACVTPSTWPKEDIDRYKDLFVEPYHRYLEILKRETTKQGKKELLQLSVDTVLKHQGRRSLKEINDDFEKRTDPAVAAEVISKRNGKKQPVVKEYERRLVSAADYIPTIQLALERMYSYRESEKVPSATGMWYRGITDAGLSILPSGLVHFAEDAGRLCCDYSDGKKGEPYHYIQAQLHNYEVFRYSVEGVSSEIDPSRYYSTINYLTLMQHYSQHTNLLDWSEDVFASTYFALEDEVNINDKYEYEQKDKEKHLKSRDKEAAVFILDPVRYNRACEEIEEEGTLFNHESGGQKKGKLQARIPNLSIRENQEAYREYHDLYQDVKSGPDIIRVSGSHKKEDHVSLLDLKQYAPEEKLDIHLPRAVYTAKLNARIRAQSGLFVAFSLKSKPVVWEDTKITTDKVSAGLFYYQALETIQEYYLKMKGKRPFLFKIIIPCDLREEIGKLMYQFGISKERIYPELENNRNR